VRDDAHSTAKTSVQQPRLTAEEKKERIEMCKIFVLNNQDRIFTCFECMTSKHHTNNDQIFGVIARWCKDQHKCKDCADFRCSRSVVEVSGNKLVIL